MRKPCFRDGAEAFERAPRYVSVGMAPPRERGRRHLSTRTPIARPARTSVAQCASTTIRVAATRPPSPQASDADFGHAQEAAEATAPTAWRDRRERRRRLCPSAECHGGAHERRAVRPLLSEHPLEKMRQDGGRDHAQQQVIGLLARTLFACARSQPKSRRYHKQNVFIRRPGQSSSRSFHGRRRIACNGFGDPPVELCRAEMPPRRHRIPTIKPSIPDAG